MNIKNIFSEYAKIARLQKEMAKYFPSFSEQSKWLKRISAIDKHIDCAHSQSDILRCLVEILKLSPSTPGCIVEAGVYKGGSSSKISLFAKHTNRSFFLFDSFSGLPENSEEHERSLLGYSIKNWFKEGNFCGSLDEVRNNIEKYGEISVCQFIKGWFDDTMPFFKEPIALAYLDVDLASSTRTCLKYLYPLLQPGGVIISQDGDFPLVANVFKDIVFWKEEVGVLELPEMDDIGKKITLIRKAK